MARSLVLLAVAVGLAALLGLSSLTSLAPASAQPASGGPLGQNDAGSGQDAGDAPEHALLIPVVRRMWTANLTPPGLDADWYRVGSSSAFCAVAQATTSAQGSVTLTASPDRDPATHRSIAPHKPTRLALAATGGHSPFFGLEPAPAMMAAGSGGSTTPSPGRYTFSLASLTPADLDPEGDGERPDAGDSAATAAPLPADCAAGRLDPSAGDGEDRYVFDVTDARELTLSFAVASGAAAQARVLTPLGATYATLESGGAAHVWAAEPGRWTVVVAPPAPRGLAATPLAPLALAGHGASALATTYLLGTTDGPGDREPCRPSCIR